MWGIGDQGGGSSRRSRLCIPDTTRRKNEVMNAASGEINSSRLHCGRDFLWRRAAFSALRGGHPPRSGEQLTQDVAIEGLQPDQNYRIASIVVRNVVRIGCVLQKTFAFLKLSPHNERVWFRRCVHRQTCHKDAMSFEHR